MFLIGYYSSEHLPNKDKNNSVSRQGLDNYQQKDYGMELSSLYLRSPENHAESEVEEAYIPPLTTAIPGLGDLR